MDFGELKNDLIFVSRITDLDQALEQVKFQIASALELDKTKMSAEEKIKHDLFLSYSINTLYFLYLKLNRIETAQHPIKNELSRIRNSMVRMKQIEERITLRPKLNVAVAGRFIRHEINDPKTKAANNKSDKRRP